MPVRQQPFGFLGPDQFAHPPLHRGLVIVDVGPAGGQAAVGRALGVGADDLAEHQHPGGAGDLLHQGFDLRIVDLPDRVGN